MKKFKILFLVTAGFFISSISFAQTPTANGNVMIFNGVAAYEPFTENENTWASLRTVAVQSNTLTTMAEQESFAPLNADTLYPDFLKEVLNIDQIFQVGNYLIKIDAINNRGLMMNAANANAYADLVNNNLSASGMMVLDGEEDFGLELLEGLENNTVTPANYQNAPIAGRRCSGARRKVSKLIPTWITTIEECPGNPTIGRTYGMDDKVVYQKFIFYFSLQSKIRSVWRCTYGGSWNFAEIYPLVDLKLIGTVKYRRRCAAEVNKAETLEEGYFGGGDGILNWRPYTSGRSLSHYDFKVDFGIRYSTDRNPNPPAYFIDSHRIISGY
jgi:hypothetical protein